MEIRKMNQLQEGIFDRVSNLRGYTSFKDFEDNYDNIIFYADGGESSVIEAMRDEFYVGPFYCVDFDGWYIALLEDVSEID